ncbi:3-dehydroquinate synthase [Aureimonas jatrophae]|uniref:3-dehydroquinate synthase n=1 Tax=Aureimonas jatrophae TaxID=1166073 RepID=A0A1H0I9Y9_9HYPH|nr:3-dehydroquinate synthase [Aureimonas jatrophae]MBB3952062.1 3-dehydroquinate synthase [Aureimonas jatrophae]SDO28185.1 3-dehydroquinate synthase [Aureimonas jatrophae]
MSLSSHPPEAGGRRSVRVELGERSYEILIGAGLLQGTGAEMARRLPCARALVVADETVAPLHAPALLASLERAGISAALHQVPAGETTKRFSELERLVDRTIAERLERGDALVALGGGVVGDLTGFAAGVVRRGMHLVQVPTSLLAQVDSSVGGKTGINSPRGKNLIGVFHQPSLVVADTAVLETLSEREFRAGYAEVAKYGLIDRPDFFGWLEANWRAVFAGPGRAEAVAVSCQAKADVVAGDERETGARALLNLGHTFGHALESAAAYDPARLVHGEAVSIGMALAHRFSTRLGLCPASETERAVRHLQAVGLPTAIREIPGPAFLADELMNKIAQDKKVQRGSLTFILTRGIGQAFVARDVEPAAVAGFLAEEITAGPA